jgi:hypothetical protein
MPRLHLVLRSLRWTLLLQLQALQSQLVELVIQLILTFDFCFRKYIALFVFDVWAFKVLVHLRWVLIKLLLGFLTYYVLSVIALNCSSCSRREEIIISLTHLLLIIMKSLRDLWVWNWLAVNKLLLILILPHQRLLPHFYHIFSVI